MARTHSLRMRTIAAAFAALLCLATDRQGGRGADWPQWGGPTRDFHAAGVEWTPWTAGGPDYLWQRPLGECSSAIASVGDTLYTMYRRGEDEVIGLDARTGAPRWSHPHPHRFGENIPTPIWSNGLLFVTSYADGGSCVLELRRRNEQTVV